MNCRETKKWLSPYLDSELEQTKTFEVSEHLRACPPCAERFDREREAERLVRERVNREAMPSELWQRLTREVSTPGWIAALRSRKFLSLAAVVVVGVVVWRVMLENRAEATQPWLVERFESEVPTDEPFAESSTELTSALAAIRDAMHIELRPPKSPDMQRGHKGLQIVSARRRTDPHGQAYFEVRLNCCGYPTLLALLPQKSDGATSALPLDSRDRQQADAAARIHMDVRTFGSITAVALSRHHVDNLLSMLQPVDG